MSFLCDIFTQKTPDIIQGNSHHNTNINMSSTSRITVQVHFTDVEIVVFLPIIRCFMERSQSLPKTQIPQIPNPLIHQSLPPLFHTFKLCRPCHNRKFNYHTTHSPALPSMLFATIKLLRQPYNLKCFQFKIFDRLTNFSFFMDGLENTLVDIAVQEATHRPVVYLSGEEEIVGTIVGIIRPFLRIVILTIEL